MVFLLIVQNSSLGHEVKQVFDLLKAFVYIWSSRKMIFPIIQEDQESDMVFGVANERILFRFSEYKCLFVYILTFVL